MDAPPKMDPQVKQRWVDALRSGDYEQGHGQLKTADGGYCCLGVLANVMGILPAGAAGYIPDDQAARFGLTWPVQSELSRLNDNVMNPSDFNTIADWIEKNL